MKKLLSKYRKIIRYSQHGEEGIIKEILNRLNIFQGTFVEFGAVDGKYCSNTYNLLQEKQGKVSKCNGVYIEGNDESYKKLIANVQPFSKRVVTFKKYVEIKGVNSLDNLLAKTKVKKDFELLIVDIDSCDYQIWKNLKNYEPKIVIIEANQFIPRGIKYIYGEPKKEVLVFMRPNHAVVTSFTSMLNLGTMKNYTLVCHLCTNMFFVRNDLAKAIQLTKKQLQKPEILFDKSLNTSIFRKIAYNSFSPAFLHNWYKTYRNLKKKIC